MSFQRLSERVEGKSRPPESGGRSFHSRGPAAEKLLSPSLLCVRGTSSFRMSLSFVPIGNESVPIQLAQCRFLGLVIHSAKILIYFQVKYTEAILSNSSRKLLWFEITKLLIVSFIRIFVKTLSIYGTPVVISLGRRNPATASERVSIGAAVSISDRVAAYSGRDYT